MGEKRSLRFGTIVRSIHLYTGLFLSPWLLIYATSAFCLNHQPWIVKKLGVTPPKWEVVSEVEFRPGQDFPQERAEQAEQILRMVELEGAHSILLGQSNAQRMVIFRPSGRGHYRVTWQRDRARIVVQRQLPLSFYRLLHFLHFRNGYHQKKFAQLAWAVVVDSVTISLWLWVLTGIYIWFRVPRKRALGSLFVLAGSILFIVLVVLLCR